MSKHGLARERLFVIWEGDVSIEHVSGGIRSVPFQRRGCLRLESVGSLERQQQRRLRAGVPTHGAVLSAATGYWLP